MDCEAKGLSIAGFVCSIIGLGIIGLVLSCVALKKQKQGSVCTGNYHGFALAGMIIGIVVCAMEAILFLTAGCVSCAALGGAAGSSSSW